MYILHITTTICIMGIIYLVHQNECPNELIHLMHQTFQCSFERERTNILGKHLITLHLETVCFFRPKLNISFVSWGKTKMIVQFLLPSISPLCTPELPISPSWGMASPQSHLWHQPDKHQRCQVPNGWQANPSSPHGSPLKQALSSFSALRQGEWRWGHGYISYMLSTNCRQMLTVKLHLSVNVKNLQQIGDTITKLSNYATYDVIHYSDIVFKY